MRTFERLTDHHMHAHGMGERRDNERDVMREANRLTNLDMVGALKKSVLGLQAIIDKLIDESYQMQQQWGESDQNKDGEIQRLKDRETELVDKYNAQLKEDQRLEDKAKIDDGAIKLMERQIKGLKTQLNNAKAK